MQQLLSTLGIAFTSAGTERQPTRRGLEQLDSAALLLQTLLIHSISANKLAVAAANAGVLSKDSPTREN